MEYTSRGGAIWPLYALLGNGLTMEERSRMDGAKLIAEEEERRRASKVDATPSESNTP